MYYFVGLGNPGKEYAGTRHNVGREVLHAFREKYAGAFSPWEYDKYYHARYSRGTLGKEEVLLLEPELPMNMSGEVFKRRKPRWEEGDTLIVVHDDLDLPLGVVKVSRGRGSGGHRGVDSLMRALGTRDFIRVRVGIAPRGGAGVARRPRGREEVTRFVLGSFTPEEREALQEVFAAAQARLEALMVPDGARHEGAPRNRGGQGAEGEYAEKSAG